MTRRITVGDSRRAFHVKRGHNREHPETPKETRAVLADPSGLSERVLGWVDRSRGRSLVAGVPVPGPSAGGGLRAVSPRGWLGVGSILAKCAPSMNECACQRPFLAYLKVKSYVDI